MDEELRRLSSGEVIWRTAAGGMLTMDEITNEHLLEIVRHIEGRGDLHVTATYQALARRPGGVYDLFLEEVERRGLEPLSEPHPKAVARFRKEIPMTTDSTSPSRSVGRG